MIPEPTASRVRILAPLLMTVKELVELLEARGYLPFAELHFYDVDTSEELSVNFEESRMTAQDIVFIPVYRLEKL